MSSFSGKVCLASYLRDPFGRRRAGLPFARLRMPITYEGGAHSARCPGVCPRVILSGGERRALDVSGAARSSKVFEVDGFLVRGKVFVLPSRRAKSIGDHQTRQPAAEAEQIGEGVFLVRRGA